MEAERWGIQNLLGVWLPQEGCDSLQGSPRWECSWMAALVPVPRVVMWLLCPQGVLPGLPGPTMLLPESFLLAHQLHLLAAQGRRKRLAKGRAWCPSVSPF